MAASAIRRWRASRRKTPMSPHAFCSARFSAWGAGMREKDLLKEFVDRGFEREVGFLAELVKVPSDNPPGDCAPHATRAQKLLQELGLPVEAHAVPAALAAAAGMQSATNLIVRHRLGEGPVIA